MLKKELREKYKKLRSELSNREQDRISQAIAHHLAAHFNLAGKKISCFVPIRRFHEINTWYILDAFAEATFYLPVMDSTGVLKHIRYEGKDKLKENSWGILEPQSGIQVEAHELDMVLVPLLTINNRGYRVGYGKGYYDRFLASCKPECIFVGLYQFEVFEQIDDLHEADILLHYCITPQGVHNLKNNSLIYAVGSGVTLQGRFSSSSGTGPMRRRSPAFSGSFTLRPLG